MSHASGRPTKRTFRVAAEELGNRYPWAPFAIFVGGPVVLLPIFYATKSPWVSYLCFFAGTTLFACLVVFIFTNRREQGGSLGSTIPTVFGPIVAQVFIRARAQPLLTVLHDGGDVLIQLAFLFAGIIGLVFYHFDMLRANGTTGDVAGVRNRRMGSFVVLLILGGVLAFSGDFAPIGASPGPILFGGYVESPGVTPLTAARIVLALWSVALATLPRSQTQTTPSPKTSTS